MGIFGGGSRAGSRAATAANVGVDQAIEELRRQFGESQQAFQPFADVAGPALAEQVRGSTAAGFGQQFGEIFESGAFDPLVQERQRAIQSQLAAGGLTRSGTALQEIAAVPQELGLDIQRILQQRQAGLTGLGFTATQNVAQLGAQAAGGVAGSLTQRGQNVSSGILTDAQAKAARRGQLINLISGGISAIGAGFGGGAGGGGGAASQAAFSFSDPRLKTNVVEISRIGDLGIYQWNWVPEAKGTSIVKQPTIGFMADEVEEKYPDFVGELATWKGIAYGPLLDVLEEKYGGEQRAA